MIKITESIKKEAIQLLKDGKYESFFELFFNVSNEVNVGNGEENNALELEIWTDGGVDMLTYIYKKDSPKEFIEWVNDFDIDETIDLYREDSQYKKDFTLKESLKDFGDYLKWLKKIVSIIKQSKIYK